MTERRRILYVCLALVAGIFALYSHVFRCEFLVFDDDSHVTANPAVMHGLSLGAIQYGCTHFIGTQWIPLTWISHALDVSLFGLDPGWHHLMNVAFHALNACLVFFAFLSLTAEFLPSVAMAALFAVHPLDVESVAWIAERKNVLSTTFWLLAMCAYARHVKASHSRWLWGVAAMMALGLLAKPMLVTLPCALLLLDFWPLKRVRTVGWPRLLLEKAPLFLLSIASSSMTMFAAGHDGFMVKSEALTLSQRLANATVSFASYVEKLAWPQHLAILYPFRAHCTTSEIVGAVLLLGAVTIVCLAFVRKMPFLLIGWLWFLGTLAPVSGIVQVGATGSADRMTYIPQLGIFFAVVWAAQRLPRPALRWAPAFCSLVVVAFAARTFIRIEDWTDTVTLFEPCTIESPGNFQAQAVTGMGWLRRGGYPEALAHFRAAEKIKPWDQGLEVLLGDSLAHVGQNEEALNHLRKAVLLDPKDEHARHNLVILLMNQGRQKEAMRWIQP